MGLRSTRGLSVERFSDLTFGLAARLRLRDQMLNRCLDGHGISSVTHLPDVMFTIQYVVSAVWALVYIPLAVSTGISQTSGSTLSSYHGHR